MGTQRFRSQYRSSCRYGMWRRRSPAEMPGPSSRNSLRNLASVPEQPHGHRKTRDGRGTCPRRDDIDGAGHVCRFMRVVDRESACDRGLFRGRLSRRSGTWQCGSHNRQRDSNNACCEARLKRSKHGLTFLLDSNRRAPNTTRSVTSRRSGDPPPGSQCQQMVYRKRIRAQLGLLSFPERSQAQTQNLYGPRAPRRDGAVHARKRRAAESTAARSLDELKIAFVFR